MTEHRSGGAAASESASVAAESIDVLLVDDDEAWVASAVAALERQRPTVSATGATDLQSARERFREEGPDCVVCGDGLAGGSDPGLLAFVREVDPDRPFVLVTDDGDESVGSDATGRRVSDVVPRHSVGDGGDLLARRVEAVVRAHRTERALARERRSKEAMLDIVTATTSRDGVAGEFCQHLVDERGYACAWIGTYDGARGLTRLAVAGDQRYPAAAVAEGARPDPDGEPALAALDRSAPVVASVGDDANEATAVAPAADVSEAERADAWRSLARERGFACAVAVPIEHDGSLVGVLATYTTAAGAVDDAEVALLAEYAETIGYAVRAAEWKRSLVGATPVTVAFAVTDRRAPLVALAGALDAGTTLEVLTAVHREDGLLYVLRTENVQVASLREAAAGVDAITAVEAADGPNRCEVAVAGETPEGVLVDAGARLLGTVVEDGRATVTVARPESDVETLAETLRATYPDASVAAIRSVEQAARRVPVDDPLRSLTAKQRQALELAYHAGYFEHPRRNNTTEVAAKLGINRTTFTQHLRTAERKLLSHLLDPGDD